MNRRIFLQRLGILGAGLCLPFKRFKKGVIEQTKIIQESPFLVSVKFGNGQTRYYSTGEWRHKYFKAISENFYPHEAVIEFSNSPYFGEIKRSLKNE